LKVEGCPDVVIQFDLPQPEEEKEAGQSMLRGSEKAEAAKASETKPRPPNIKPLPVVATQKQLPLVRRSIALRETCWLWPTISRL